MYRWKLYPQEKDFDLMDVPEKKTHTLPIIREVTIPIFVQSEGVLQTLFELDAEEQQQDQHQQHKSKFTDL